MKKRMFFNVSIGLIALLLIAFYSCKSVDGECTPKNFSSDLIILNKNKQSKTIHASKNLDWRFKDLEVDGTFLTKENGKEKIEGEWFTLEKVNNKTIKISVTEASKDRKLSFSVWRGNCTQEIQVVQLKES